MSIEDQICYFCDTKHLSLNTSNYNGLFVCDFCDSMLLPINFNNHENGECCVCFEETSLFKLSKCSHRLCLQCCKTIYVGSTTNERPVDYLRDVLYTEPDWPFIFNDEDDNDPERIKNEEYSNLEIDHFDMYLKYDELITIRDELISIRPEWMNSDTFINYENSNFKYHTECIKLEKEWEIYHSSKIKGNSKCPLCRA